jgi:Tol biopolymer transport system component
VTRAFVRWALILCALTESVHAQAPSTDIFLAPIKRIRDSIVIGPATNITNRPGYDNQPSFLPNSSGILYTVVGADAQADIWRYDIAAHRNTRVTTTTESEYSATVMPGGLRMSVIRVEADSAQRLWSFGLDGSNPQVLLTALKPVGYHAWLSPSKLATFVLGTPATLHVIDSDGSHDEIRARDIGRSLHRIPGRDAFSYTQRDSAKALWIMTQTVTGESETMLVRASADNEYHAWTPDAILLTVTGGVLVRWNRALDATRAWMPVADLSKSGVKNVSRLAVSPDGKWLAFVAEPVAP